MTSNDYYILCDAMNYMSLYMKGFIFLICEGDESYDYLDICGCLVEIVFLVFLLDCLWIFDDVIEVV